jgi:hypothetical protein
MKSSIYKSINLSNTLEFDYSVNLRRYARPTNKRYWEQYLINKTENSALINYSVYNLEKDESRRGSYHTHYLTKLNNDISFAEFTDATKTIFADLVDASNHKTTEGINRKLLKIQTENGNYEDKYFDIPFTKIYSKSGLIYLEPVVQTNIIYYNNKYSDWGITDGFILGKRIV